MAQRFDIRKIPIRYIVLFAISTASIIFLIIASQFIVNFYNTKKILEIYNTAFNIKTEISFLQNNVHTIFSDPYKYIDEKEFSKLFKSIEKINHYLSTISKNPLAQKNIYYHKIIEQTNEYKINLQKCQTLNYKLFNPTESKLAAIDNLIYQLKTNNAYLRSPFSHYTAELINIINHLKEHDLPNEIISQKLNDLEKNLSKLNVRASQLTTKNNMLIIVDKLKSAVADYLFLLDQYGKPLSSGILKKLNTDILISSTSQFLDNINNSIIKRRFYFRSITFTILTIIFALIIISLGTNLYFILTRNLNKITSSLIELELGNLERKELIKTTKELGFITLTINRIASNFKYKAQIIENFSQGKYEQQIHPLSPNDILAQNLINLKDYLQTYEQNIEQTRQSEAKQKWVTQGLALLGDTLREHATNLQDLLETSLKTMLDYIKAPMGAIYYKNEMEQELVYELKIAFAYDKKKMHKVKYRLTEGFVGTVAADGEPIILKQVPEDYIFYETAFGHGRPDTIAWFPIKEENTIFGVLEIALSGQFEHHHLQLINKFTSDLASTITFVNINQQTRHLVQQLTEKTEEFERREIEYRLTIEDLNDQIHELKNQVSELKLEINIKQEIISEKVTKIIELEEKIKDTEKELKQTIERFRKAEELYKTKIANLEEQIKKLSNRDSQQ